MCGEIAVIILVSLRACDCLLRPKNCLAIRADCSGLVEMNAPALKLARELRRAGVRCELGDETFRLKKSFEAAEKAGAKYIVIVGENEVASDEFAVKELATGEQESVARAELAEYLRAN